MIGSYLGNDSVIDAEFEVFLHRLVAVLGMVHTDAGRNPLHIRTLLLIPETKDGDDMIKAKQESVAKNPYF